jgi:ketosteroid isomerase-like protein
VRSRCVSYCQGLRSLLFLKDEVSGLVKTLKVGSGDKQMRRFGMVRGSSAIFSAFALALTLGALIAGPAALAQRSRLSQGAQTAPGRQIDALLLEQAEDWNRGDLDAFARGYKDAPDILFMGSTIRKGYMDMVAGYRKRYPTKENMGVLHFSALEVQPLDARFATATGRFSLERSAAGGGAAAGYFLLVLEKTGTGWKIIRDDTTGTVPKAACAPAPVSEKR